jgi:hypothetical protein
MPRWPHRYQWVTELGYVVWRDVFDDGMRCEVNKAVLAHKVAVFVTEAEAKDYCDYRNKRTILLGTDAI